MSKLELILDLWMAKAHLPFQLGSEMLKRPFKN